MIINIVGDKPSKKNLDKNVAFVGTKSYKVLLNWIYKMNININDAVLHNKDDEKLYYMILEDKTRNIGYKYIALGNKAEKTLSAYQVNYFKLPHPSGLNRLTNNKNLINKKLKECVKYIHE